VGRPTTSLLSSGTSTSMTSTHSDGRPETSTHFALFSLLTTEEAKGIHYDAGIVLELSGDQ